MNPKTAMSSGRSCRGRAAGQESTAFDRALRSVYDKARGVSNPEPRWVLNPRNGHRVGVIKRENGILVFERRVQESRHRLKMFGGSWALEMPLLTKLEAFGVQWERIITDTGRVLCVPLTLYREHGKTINYPGFGVQVALRESCFSDCIHDGFVEAEDPDVTPIKNPLIQPCLFAEGGL